ncbi:MAG: serpin family protein [Bacteroidota bacterium]
MLRKEPDALGEIERRLAPDSLTSRESRMKTELVRVALPKFRLETGYELAGVLGAMGMRDAFTRNADFSGMPRERPLFLSKQTVGAHRLRTPIPFLADRPFLFMIRSRVTGAILFMGRVEDPSRQ